MYLQSAIILLAASGAHATAVLAQRAPAAQLVNREVSQGWSLQSGSGPTDLHSCGNGAYCPISLHCNSMVNNHQVAACCSSSSDCRGEVEGSPKCADDSWNLWVGYDGNGFCCESGLVGAYDITKSVAGVCVSSDNVGSLRSAQLTSTGSGSAPTSVVSASSAAAATTTAGALTSSAASHASSAISSASAKASSASSSAASVESSVTKTSSTAGSTSTGSATSSSSAANASSTGSPSTTPNSAAGLKVGGGLMGAALLAVLVL